MADFLIDFEWYRNSKGCKIVPWKSLNSADVRVTRSGDCIVANGGSWTPYRPLDKFDTLYAAFANVKTPGELLNFINKFGPLSRSGFAVGESGPEQVRGGATWGDDVSYCLRQAKLFRELLLRQRRPKALARFFLAELRAADARSHKEAYERAEEAAPDTIEADPTWPSIPWAFDVTIDARKGLRLRLKSPPPGIKTNDPWLDIQIGEIDLVADANKGLRLRLKTDSLKSALWWQLGQKLSGNAIIRECRQCDKLFEVGRNTGRRSDATFCCNEHSVRFHSLRRSRGG